MLGSESPKRPTLDRYNHPRHSLIRTPRHRLAIAACVPISRLAALHWDTTRRCLPNPKYHLSFSNLCTPLVLEKRSPILHGIEKQWNIHGGYSSLHIPEELVLLLAHDRKSESTVLLIASFRNLMMSHASYTYATGRLIPSSVPVTAALYCDGNSRRALPN